MHCVQLIRPENEKRLSINIKFVRAAASRFNQWQRAFDMIPKIARTLNGEGMRMRESFNFETV